MMNQYAVFMGAFRYEFRMQVRRRALWITMLLLFCLLVAILGRSAEFLHMLPNLNQFPILTVVSYWTGILNSLLPIGIGVLLADRFVRDRRTKVDELFVTLPGNLSARLSGKYLGSMCATLLPMLLCYAVGIGVIVALTHNIQAIPLAVETFAVIVLPGIFFISAFSLACPALMWVPLYQFCFIGYWFWGNDLAPHFGIPTLSETLLTPIGKYMEVGFFKDGRWWDISNATPLSGVESMLLLMGLALVALVALWAYLRWQQARQ